MAENKEGSIDTSQNRVNIMRTLKELLDEKVYWANIHYDPDEDETLMYFDPLAHVCQSDEPRFECLFDFDRRGVFRDSITYAYPCSEASGRAHCYDKNYTGFCDDYGHWYIVHTQDFERGVKNPDMLADAVIQGLSETRSAAYA